MENQLLHTILSMEQHDRKFIHILCPLHSMNMSLIANCIYLYAHLGPQWNPIERNTVLLVKIEQPVWYNIYHHYLLLMCNNQAPLLYNIYESTNQWELGT